MEASVVIIIVGTTGAIVSLLFQVLNLKRREAVTAETTEQRIQRLSGSLIEAARLIGEIEEEIKGKHSLVEKLKSDIETYSEIATLKESEVEAVAQVLRKELSMEVRRSFWRTVAVNFGFFIGGAIVSGLLVTLL